MTELEARKRAAEIAALLRDETVPDEEIIRQIKAEPELVHAKCRSGSNLFLEAVVDNRFPVAQALRGLLEPGQIILIFNGSWGAAEFSAILGDEAREKNVRVCETSAQLFLCSSPEECSVHIKTIKKSVAMACAAPPQTPGALAELATVFPQLTAGSNVLDTSLNSSNPVVHGPIALFNITRLENGEDYTLFGTALPRKTVDYIEKIDAERRAVIQAMGVEIGYDSASKTILLGKQPAPAAPAANPTSSPARTSVG